MSKSIVSVIAYALGVLYLIVVVMYAVGVVPLSWDEGWNFCTARTWLELHHYGCLILGEATGPRLTTGYAATLSARLGFAWFGVSIPAGRSLFALQTFAAIICMFLLVRSIWGYRVAVATVAVLIFFPCDWRLHPLLFGPQAWGEGPMLLFIVLGYAALTRSLTSTCLWCPVASFFFACAMFTKLQSRPFIMIGLLAAGVLAYSAPHRRAALHAVACGLLAWYLEPYISAVGYYSAPHAATIKREGWGMEGGAEVLGFVLAPHIRLAVLKFTVSQMWFLICGFVFMLVSHRLVLRRIEDPAKQVVAQSIGLLSGTWFLWFVCLAMSFPRYAAPAIFFGSPFVACWLAHLSHDFDWRATIGDYRNLFAFRGRLGKKCIFAGLSTLLVVQILFSVYQTSLFLRSDLEVNQALHQTAEYLNSTTSHNAVVETYESQLLFLLRRKYHYPPDQVSLDNTATSQGRTKTIDYDPLRGNPDYIVTGPWNDAVFHVYDTVVRDGRLKKVRDFPPYSIYAIEPAK